MWLVGWLCEYLPGEVDVDVQAVSWWRVKLLQQATVNVPISISSPSTIITTTNIKLQLQRLQRRY